MAAARLLVNSRFRTFDFLRCMPVFAKAQDGQLGRQRDPVVDEFSKLTIVFQLLLNFRQIFCSDKLARALSVSLKTNLIIRAVSERGTGFAPAIGLAADIILLR